MVFPLEIDFCKQTKTEFISHTKPKFHELLTHLNNKSHWVISAYSPAPEFSVSQEGCVVVPGSVCTLWLHPGDFSLCPGQRTVVVWSPVGAHCGHPAPVGIFGMSILRVGISLLT